jgi:predicted Zn finger-like uncharacterized protein
MRHTQGTRQRVRLEVGTHQESGMKSTFNDTLHLVDAIDAPHRGEAEQLEKEDALAALLDDDQGVLLPATCPMCHTRASVTESAIESGGEWRCVRCGQHWDAARLAAVATYAAWVADHDRAGRPALVARQGPALYRDPPTARKDGRE